MAPHRSVLMMMLFFLKKLPTLHLVLDLDVSKSTNGSGHDAGLGEPEVMSAGTLTRGKNQILSEVAWYSVA
jgi:hypothetical protein